MKKSILILIASILLSYPISLMGADFETTHEFKSGDTISADMMNELFENIKLSKTNILSSDLVGTWSCKVSVRYSNNNVSDWTVDSDSLYNQLTSEITFSADGDGTYSYQSSAPNPFYATDARAIGSGYNYIVASNSFYFKYPRYGSGQSEGDQKANYHLSKISKTSYLFTLGFSDLIPTPDSLICDKQNLPPIAPTLDNVTASGKTVSLAWTDNSDDETGFNVLRKDTLKGIWDNVTTSSTSADATSYIDTVTAAGLYWYRVSATNSNGDSTGSKVVKVDVE